MLSTNDIRRSFLEYFGKNNHEIVHSSSLVPHNDPTLMFANSGMVQFKNVFTGKEKREIPRATTAQKCVRAGGKHNDLENVGYTARHHTFFEMLGNFSFGDYFKDQAIELAWNYIHKELSIPKDKLCVTVYHDDTDAANYWKKIAGLPEEKIIRIATSDNFWSMGDTGPCGPCSEIFYDHGEGIFGGPPGSADQDGDRFTEIWNLVFMQYEQISKDERVALPKPSIDTGMGLERIAAVMQGKHNNYDIDLFTAIIEASSTLTKSDPKLASHKVISDHLRSSAFLIADGVLPSNEGRGYVLRRIMRRAMRHVHMLGYKDALMWQLVAVLNQQMSAAYPELKRAESLIVETLKLEETRFKEMLGRGMSLLDSEVSKLNQGQALAGDVAFKLYDTFGFPLDLTADVLKSHNLSVDHAGFDAAMAKQKAAARASWVGSGEKADEKIWFEQYDTHGATEFLGYSQDEAEAKIVAIIHNGKSVQAVKAGDENVEVLVNQTPFYAESGGQLGDQGTINQNHVGNTQKKIGSLHVHVMDTLVEPMNVGAEVTLTIDTNRRASLRIHHSATHLLHDSLRRFLGEHVTQKGSMVAADRLRFDFSHNKPLSKDEIQKVELEINKQVRLNTPVETILMTPDEAINAGAMALFGEKYGDEVRVVAMGENKYSTELCGGTHVSRTGDIGLFKIISETSVSSGIRRIEAVAGEAAINWLYEKLAILDASAESLKTTHKDLPERVRAVLDEQQKLKMELGNLRKKSMLGEAADDDIATIGNITFLKKVMSDIPAGKLRDLSDHFIKKADIVSLISTEGGKASMLVRVNPDKTAQYNAVELVKIGAKALGGQGGGGRPEMAQAGGPDVSAANQAFSDIEQALRSA